MPSSIAHHYPNVALSSIPASRCYQQSRTHRPAKKRCQFKVIYNIPVKSEGEAEEAAAAPESSPKPMTANPPTQCPSAALKFAGDCPHCNKVFCSVHRTPETHNW